MVSFIIYKEQIYTTIVHPFALKALGLVSFGFYFK